MLSVPSDPAILIRPFIPADRDALPSLLDMNAGEIWRRQFFPLHGALSAQSIVAEMNGQVVGAASILRSEIHPTGTACAIDVHPNCRRRGIGTLLFEALRQLHPEAFPLRTKVEMESAEAFVRNHGGSAYQICRGDDVPLDAPKNLAWAVAALRPSGVTLMAASEVDDAELLDAFANLYIWQHAGWNSVESVAALRRVLAVELDELDRHVSIVASRENRIAAIALAFPGEKGALDVVAETVREDEAGGIDILTSTIATLIPRASAMGWKRLVFDGHVTDPHLAPVLDSIPVCYSGTPLLLMEISR